ncbi:MAG: glycosyltransferase family 4 protein, partial [Halioglobus sp.]
EYGVESLVVSSLIGHSLDLLCSDLPTTFVLHDFFPFCPALYATFGSSCQSCSAGELQECAVRNPLHSFFKCESDVHWLAVRASFIEMLASDAICAIAPTQSVADRYRQLEPRLEEKTIHIVPHGLDQQLSTSLKSVSLKRASDAERLRVVVLGRMTAEKGGDLLAEIIGAVTGFADVWLLGAGESGERFENLPSVSVVASYHKTELAALLQQVDPDLGLLLSIVPETFSYTLSELWAAGLPVLATRLGAFSDRILDGGNGWLSDIQPRAVLEKLQWLDGNRAELERIREALLDQEVRSAEAMTADYSALEAIPERLPLARFHLPRRSYQNPYAKKREEQKNGREEQALYVDHQLPYRQVLGEFLTYSAGKMQQTPRIAGFVRGGSSRFLRFLAGLVAPN